MAEISNKTIAGVLLVSIAVSLVGTLISLSKLSSIGPVRVTLTGSATANGSVFLNVSQSVSINITDSVISFGNGFVNESGTAPCNITTNGSFIPGGTSRKFCYCDMGTGNSSNQSFNNSNGTYSVPNSPGATGFDKNTTDPTSSEVLNASTGFCAGFLGDQASTAAEFIEVENTGTINWSELRVYGTDPDVWIGGGTGDYPDEAFQGGCVIGNFTRAANITGQIPNVTEPYQIDFQTTANQIPPGAVCARNIPFADTFDRVRFDVFVRVPKDAPLATQTPASVIFVAGG